ncbi:hypothetical protein GCM10022255_006350 [Dactylosporangium darangshiense]|uniref:Uncharacterized protein n=1 Tax=Dactylosporangium darangshiense TaxID=579108 RepID=A0ABP8CXF4_9ACTN
MALMPCAFSMPRIFGVSGPGPSSKVRATAADPVVRQMPSAGGGELAGADADAEAEADGEADADADAEAAGLPWLEDESDVPAIG